MYTETPTFKIIIYIEREYALPIPARQCPETNLMHHSISMHFLLSALAEPAQWNTSVLGGIRRAFKSCLASGQQCQFKHIDLQGETLIQGNEQVRPTSGIHFRCEAPRGFHVPLPKSSVVWPTAMVGGEFLIRIYHPLEFNLKSNVVIDYLDSF